MLSLTPIEDAWGLNGRTIDKLSPYEQLKRSQNQHNAERIETIDTIQAYNDENEYDEYLIRVESFKPLRIDIAIQNAELIEFMKNLSYVEQQQKATELLLDYFRAHSSHPIDNSLVHIDEPVAVDQPESSVNVEYFKATTNRTNDVLMLLVLAVLVFILYEKLGGLTTQQA
jgi:hypothetical protein